MTRQVNLTGFIQLKIHVIFFTAKNDVNFSHAQYQAFPHAFSKHFAKWLLLKNVLLAKAYM